MPLTGMHSPGAASKQGKRTHLLRHCFHCHRGCLREVQMRSLMSLLCFDRGLGRRHRSGFTASETHRMKRTLEDGSPCGTSSNLKLFLVKLRLPTCPLSICHSSGSCSGQATLPIGSSLQYHTPSFLLQSPEHGLRLLSCIGSFSAVVEQQLSSGGWQLLGPSCRLATFGKNTLTGTLLCPAESVSDSSFTSAIPWP